MIGAMSDIRTPRLILRLVPQAGLAATASHDLAACRRLIGDVPDDWFSESWLAELRLDQWKNDPDYAPWSIRVIALHEGAIAGYINCHDKPVIFEHRGEVGLMIELGYTIFEPYRRRGLATEAIEGLTAFAAEHDVRWIRFSIAPDNVASVRLAQSLGAVKIGAQIDERDGPEDVYLLDID